jgi:hypothetical protein
MTQSEEITHLRAELAAGAQNSIVILITALQELRAGREIDPEALAIVEQARKVSSW